MVLKGFVHSDVLEKDTGICVVTPHVMNKSEYKVAYVLHGLGGSEFTWSEFSMLPVYAMETNTVFIMPNAERSFYTDMKHGFKFFTYVSQELPQIAKSLFNITSKRENTAVIGVSMGGYGALKCALTRPELFGMCGAISSACIYTQNELSQSEKMCEKYGTSIMNDMRRAFGDELCAPDCDDIPTLAKKAENGNDGQKFFACCGLSDPYHSDNVAFAEQMKKQGFNYKYEEWQGGHELPFFNEALKKIIENFNL